jgi:citrate lyase subunit beta/citryl-CoA lyase
VEALHDIEWHGKEHIVRVNKVGSPWAADDIKAASSGGATAVLLGKVDRPWEVEAAAAIIDQVSPRSETKIWCMIESALGVMKVEEIAFASPKMDGLFFGAGDFSADIGVRSKQLGSKPHSSPLGVARGIEYNYARSRVVVAAAAAGLWRWEGGTDSRRDFDAVYANAQQSFQFGFDGVSVVTPRHLEHVHRAYAPSKEDLEWAQGVVDGANADATAGGTVGVVHDAMVDGPVYLHAAQVLARAAVDDRAMHP